MKTINEFKKELFERFNGDIILLGQFNGNKIKTKFHCNKCNFIWDTTPQSILKSTYGCRKCASQATAEKLRVKNINKSGRFVDLCPDLAARFDENKNINVNINELSPHSGMHIWWKCEVCGYSWNSKVASVVDHKGNCPNCYRNYMTNNVINYRLNNNGSFVYNYPELLGEWDYDKNIDIDPNQLLEKSNKKVWWKCKRCGNEWRAKISKRTSGQGCPCCYRFSKSRLQKKVQTYIEDKYDYIILHEFDCSLKCRNPKTNHILPYDNEVILNNDVRLIIECNGEQHCHICGLTKLDADFFDITPEEALNLLQYRDKLKKEYALSHGYEFLVIPYWTESDDSYKTLIDNKISEILSLTTQN